MRRFLPVASAALVLAVACNSKDNGTLALLVGGEADALTRAPAPATYVVETYDTSGKTTTIATVTASSGTLNLTDQSESTTAAFRVTGLDAAGIPRVRGLSMFVDFTALAGSTLDIFVQRTGELARMPGPLSDSRESPVVAAALGRYIFAAGGSDPNLGAVAQLYDLASYSPLASPPALPIAPTSVTFSGTVAYLINDSAAMSYDLSTVTSATLTAPTGGTFGEISGGATIALPDGSSYIVGGTRLTGMPTPRVLYVDASGNFSFVTLAAARLGASATWISGTGLIIVGGSATGAGVEVVGPGAKVGLAQPYPPDATTGAGAAVLSSSQVLVVGGLTATGTDAQAKAITVGCTAGCAATPWPMTAFATPLVTAQAFDVDGTTAFVVGNDAAGSTHAFRVTSAAALGIALKVPRKNARAVFLPTSAVAVVGGATLIESFLP